MRKHYLPKHRERDRARAHRNLLPSVLARRARSAVAVVAPVLLVLVWVAGAAPHSNVTPPAQHVTSRESPERSSANPGG